MDAGNPERPLEGSSPPDAGGLGIVLSGGGARGAYQAGVLAGIADIAARHRIPVRVLAGLSAGSINVATVAAGMDDLPAASAHLVSLWSELTAEQVYRTDVASLARNAVRWMRTASSGGHPGRRPARSLVDTSPLRRFLEANVDFERVRGHVAAGRLGALALTATDFGTGTSVTFVEGGPRCRPWQRARRVGLCTPLRVDHLMASSAIPLLFPAARIGERWYGDGSLRNPAPLSPAVHLGADRIVAVGVRGDDHVEAFDLSTATTEPGLGRVLALVINGALMDGIDMDLERLGRLNETARALPPDVQRERSIRPVAALGLRPTADLGALALDHKHTLPAPVRFLVDSLGPGADSGDLYSYLLFEPNYGRALCELGRADVEAQRDEVAAVLTGEAVPVATP